MSFYNSIILKCRKKEKADRDLKIGIKVGLVTTIVMFVINMLVNALKEDFYEAENGVELLCCMACGLCGCWSIEVYMKEDDKFVYWYKIVHNHREWKYDLSFKFEKEAYYQALKVLAR